MGKRKSRKEKDLPTYSPWRLLTIFLLAALGILVAGYLYYRAEERDILQQKKEELIAIANLKVGQITSWLQERRGDGEALRSNTMLARQVRQFFIGSREDDFQEIWAYLFSVRNHYGYRAVQLLDTKGAVRGAAGSQEGELGKTAAGIIREALASGKVVLSDLHARPTADSRDIRGTVHLEIAAPLRLSSPATEKAVGVVLLTIAPEDYLFPLIQTWPTPSPTAETLLVRRDGDQVVYLNELRHRKGTALSLRFPLDQTTLPAAMALSGKEGLVEGWDYRGLPVVAALRRVPDSNWSLVAKVDAAEVYASLRKRRKVIAFFTGLLLCSTAVVFYLLWKHQQIEYLKRHRDQLEYLVKKRTTELEAANKELEAFAYSVSHDLRSPLRGIDGYSQVLLEDYRDKLDADGRFVLSQVRASTQEMGMLIDDLLEFSRLGRREMRTTTVPLSTLFTKIFADLRKNNPDRRLELTLGDLPAATGDPAMLQQAVRNLLENAVKFTRPRERGGIEVGTLPNPEGVGGGNPPQFNTYFIRDNGVGFDMQYADKLFKVFQRLHRAEEFEGTGIGLALVKRIVERHGGRVWAEGQKGEGATFYFKLPNANANAECGVGSAE